MSENVSDSVRGEATRRRLSERQADTVERITRSGVDVLGRIGYAAMTIRLVAADAGVGAATVYTYFSSKEHLIAEIFWRRLATLIPPEIDGLPRAARVVAVLRSIALLVADESELAGAVTSSLLGADPDVGDLRRRIGGTIRARLVEAWGPDPDHEIIECLELIYAGALVRAGMGIASYTEIADLMETSARRVLL